LCFLSQSEWPELETLILVVNDAKKDTSSTAGMSQSVKTSLLLGFRAKEVVDKRLTAIEAAFKVTPLGSHSSSKKCAQPSEREQQAAMTPLFPCLAGQGLRRVR
jgi:hypothetical protein